MRSETEEKQEKIRRQTRLRARKFYGIVIISEESKFDIPRDCPLSKYWRRWSEMRRDVDAACARFWAVRKGKKGAYANCRGKFQRKKFSCQKALRNN